ncbi:MAG: hypothetical protein DMG51_09990 [Acidobacteria bacterium]|nr:MAG: hypothetical protein DMG51_09990 [Acidobacteriota bacterium]
MQEVGSDTGSEDKRYQGALITTILWLPFNSSSALLHECALYRHRGRIGADFVNAAPSSKARHLHHQSARQL